jgi:hypothetical protein
VADTFCSQCGVLLERPGRFCRQCGAPVSSTPDSAEVGSSPDYQPGATLRPPTSESGAWGSPVGGSLPFPGSPGSVPAPVPRRSRLGKILLAAGLFLLLLAGGVSFAAYRVYQRVRTEISQFQSSDLLQLGKGGALPEQIDRALREGSSPLSEDEDVPPASDLTPYLYPGAKRVQSTRIVGNEMLRFATTDSFDQVDTFYRKLAGDPFAENRSATEQQSVYKLQASPTTIVTISADAQQKGETNIVILRSPHLAL